MKTLSKILILAIATMASSQVLACGAPVANQSFPSVPLSEFGMDSWKVAKTAPIDTTPSTFDYSVCIQKTIYGGTPVPSQKFPSVPLSEFNMDSWKVAK